MFGQQKFATNLRECQSKVISFFARFAKMSANLKSKSFLKNLGQTFFFRIFTYRVEQKYLEKKMRGTCCSRYSYWSKIFGPFFLDFPNMPNEQNA